jgi:hypothetical protein
MEMDGFGHSLAGLLSLSLPSLTSPAPPARFQPRAILAANPATSTEIGIPGFVIALLKLFNAPFTANPLRIEDTGPHIQQPVAILHGLADTLVPPQFWAVQGTYDDDLFKAFGGVKHGPSAYNTTWIWPALHLLFQTNADPPAPARRWWPWLRAAGHPGG